jgi:hypothetical protein
MIENKSAMPINEANTSINGLFTTLLGPVMYMNTSFPCDFALFTYTIRAFIDAFKPFRYAFVPNSSFIAPLIAMFEAF